MFIRHEWFEKNALLLLIGSLLTISIGGIVEIVPLFLFRISSEHASGIVNKRSFA